MRCKSYFSKFLNLSLFSLFIGLIGFQSIMAQDSRGAGNRQLIQESISSGKRLALVIGNAAYPTAPLKNPVNDANDIAAALRETGFEVIYKENLNQNDMKRAVRDFGIKLKTSGGVGLFYFAGHGVQVKGINYLVPIGATVESEEEVEYEAVDAGFVLAQMEAAQNPMNIVILDACRNNPFARSMRSETKGLAQMDAPSGTIIAYATAPGSVASDGAAQNGLYTQELLKTIRTSGLGIEDIFKRVRISVRSATANKQTPWESSSLVGDFYFKGGKSEIVPNSPIVDIPNTNKEQAKILYDRGYDYNLRGEYTLAISELNKAVELNPQYALAYNSLGYAYNGKSEYDIAIKMLNKAIQFDPKLALAYNNLGLALWGKKDYDQALYNFDRAIEIDPKNSDSFGNRGSFYFEVRRNYENAIADFTKAIELNPKDEELLKARADIYNYKKEYRLAIDDYSRIIELNRKNAWTYYNRGLNLLLLNEYEQAISDFTKTIEIDPKNEFAYLNRGDSYFFWKKDYNQAIIEFNKAIELKPDFASAYERRGFAYLMKRQIDLSMADCAKVIELEPTKPSGYTCRARIYESKGDKSRAEADRQKASELARQQK